MNPSRTSLRRRMPGIVRWVIPGALALLMPKCLGCLVAYAAIAAGLGLGGREICGGGWSHAPGAPLWLAGALSAASFAVFVARRGKLRRRLGFPAAAEHGEPARAGPDS